MLKDMGTAAAVTFAALFPIVNPIGNVPIFHALSTHMNEARRRSEAKKSALATFFLLVGFLFVGRFVLDFFGISLAALEIAGGLVVAHAAWGMVTKGLEEPEVAEGEPPPIFMSPMTMPLLAGPGALGVTLGLATRHGTAHHYVGSVLGIAGIGVLILVLLLYGQRPLQRLGNGGIDAMIRTMGLIVLAIAVELVYHGVTAQDV